MRSGVWNVNATGAGCRSFRAEAMLLLFAAAFPVFCAQGQANPSATDQSSAPAAPAPAVSAQEVSLDLVVHDRKLRPVLDLKPDDLAITDDGSPVKFTSLHLVNGNPAGDNLITVLVDPLNPNAKQSVRDAAAQMLKIVPAQGFSIAVLNVDGRLRLRQRFTSDRKLIEQGFAAAIEPEPQKNASKPAGNGSDAAAREDAASPTEQELISVARTGSDLSGAPVSVKDRALSRALYSALENAGQIAQDQHLPPSLAGIMALVQSERQLAQRRSILYFTHGRPLDSRAKDAMRSIIGEANRSGITIYIVDLKSLDRSAIEKLDHSSLQGFGYGNATLQYAAYKETTGNMNDQYARTVQVGSQEDLISDKPLQQLAESTGGSYVGADDSVRKSLERMVREMSVYYEAKYVPPIQNYDGSFRPLVVKPLRAGLTVRTNSGYYALPPNSGGDLRPSQVPLLKILNAVQPPADVVFHAAVLRLGDLRGLDSDVLAVEMPLRNVEFHEDTSTGLYYARLSILAQIKDQSGDVIETFSEDLPRRGALEQIESARDEVITFQRHFSLPPGAYSLNAAILDANSGRAGARRIAFDIPPPAPLSLSDVVLVRKVEPPTQSPDAGDSLDPMRHGAEKVTADISGQVPQDVKQLSIFFITHPDPKGPEQATYTIGLSRKGRPLLTAPANPTPVGSGAAATSLVALSMKRLLPGDYEVRVTVTQGGRSVETAAPFTVMGEPLASAGNVVAVTSSDTNDDDFPPVEIGIHGAGQLKIETAQTAVPPPPADELNALLADAARRANEFTQTLPNFMCVQVTDRSARSRGDTKWWHEDNFVELLQFRNGEETRTMLEVDGSKSDLDREGLAGMTSYGEFGGVLKAVFQPSSKAAFQWRATGTLGDGAVQIFDYQVARENSTFSIGLISDQVIAGFHGQVFLDSSTRSVRRVTMVADKMDKSPLDTTTVSVDYDYVQINNHDYLLPVSGQVSTRLGRSKAVLNQIEFRDYRRFGSNARILDFTADPK